MQDYGHEIIVGMGSTICTGVGAYFVVGQKLAYIQGQLSQLLHLEKKIESQSTRLESVSQRLDKHDQDLRVAHSRIRDLQQSLVPTSLHPK